MTEVAMVFAVSVLASVLKTWVHPRFGKLGVQVSVFLLAVLGSLYLTYGSHFASLQTIVMGAVGVFSLAVTLYEVLLSRISLLKKGK